MTRPGSPDGVDFFCLHFFWFFEARRKLNEQAEMLNQLIRKTQALEPGWSVVIWRSLFASVPLVFVCSSCECWSTIIMNIKMFRVVAYSIQLCGISNGWFDFFLRRFPCLWEADAAILKEELVNTRLHTATSQTVHGFHTTTTHHSSSQEVVRKKILNVASSLPPKKLPTPRGPHLSGPARLEFMSIGKKSTMDSSHSAKRRQHSQQEDKRGAGMQRTCVILIPT